MHTNKIKLASNEIWPLLNLLNEVCHGIPIRNFKESIGAEKQIVVDLMDKISQEEDKNVTTLILNDFELDILQRSFEEVFRLIDTWEFQTRIGISMQDAKNIKNKF